MWEILSGLFLDNEIDMESIADGLTLLQLPVEDIEFAYRYEVAPVLYVNLSVAAGMWDGFDRQWLITAIQELKHGPPLLLRCSIFRRIYTWYCTRSTTDDWHKLQKLL